ncbi:hypothetical protein [Nitrincola sp.]
MCREQLHEVQRTHRNGRAIPALRECELQLVDTDLPFKRGRDEI